MEWANEQETKTFLKIQLKQKTLPHAEELNCGCVFIFYFCQIGTFSKNLSSVFSVQRIFLFNPVQLEIELRLLKTKGL